MKGCARSCLLWLIGWAAASGAVFYYLRQFGVHEPQLWWAAAGAGLFAVFSISYAVAIVKFAKERSMLLGAMVGQPPKDGQWVAVSGTIRSIDPVRTPVTGVAAVAYDYDIFRIETRSSGRNSSTSKHSYYQGKALAPSTIATRQGAVRLLAVPTLDVPADEIKTEAGTINARKYVSETTFQTFSMPKGGKIGMEHELTDDDGMFRVDKRGMPDVDVDIADCTLSERYIKQGETVCAFGLYSAARGGLIPHPNWAKQARLMRGDATAVAGQLRTRMVKYVFGILIFGGAAFGIVKFYEHYARTLMQ
jgi:hypothetical protein